MPGGRRKRVRIKDQDLRKPRNLFFAVKAGEEIGENVICPQCGKEHKIQYGKWKEEKKWVPSKLLGFVKCRKKSHKETL